MRRVRAWPRSPFLFENDVKDGHMKKIICVLLLALMALAVMGAAAEEILYTATVTRDMTIRATKSTSGKKLGSVEANEFISVIDYESQWTKVEKDGVVGYILSKNVIDLAAAAGYNDLADAQYIGVADKTLTVRSEMSVSVGQEMLRFSAKLHVKI